MNCYTMKIYLSAACEEERDAVIELNAPDSSAVACYRIATDGAVTQVPDVRLTTEMEDTCRQVLRSILRLDAPERKFRSYNVAAERRVKAA